MTPETAHHESLKKLKRPRGVGRHLAGFARELSVLVSTGTPMVESLAALERQAADERWRVVVGDVRRRVEEGDPLSQALAAHPQIFDPVSRSLMAAGESSGRMESMLDRLAQLTRRKERTRAMIAGAMVYPALLLTVGSGVLVLMLTFVLPRFSGLFETLETPLPATTKFLVSLSEILRGYWFIVFPVIIGFVVAVVFWSKSVSGRTAIQTVSIRMPKLGVVSRTIICAQLARVLGVLLESRVPMMEALDLTRQSMSNHHYTKLISRAEDAVTRGDPISSAFASDTKLVTAALSEAIRNGEQSGRLAEVLLRLADYLDEENETVLKSLASILEPIIMIGLGVVVGFIAVSMFLPLFDLTASAGGGAP